MKIITTETISGAVSVPVYAYSEIPYTDIMMQAEESKKRGGCSYLEIPCAFDIETTNIFRRTTAKKKGKKVQVIDPDFRPFAFMYHWQCCIGYRVIFGRTWEEFQKMLAKIERDMNLSHKLHLVIYVHNLSFEMQFMRRFINVTDSFCKSDRQPLKVVHNDCIEFRCSAALSNMNLTMFCKSENARFYKLEDTFDYSKIRTSETILTQSEEGYCYNDVRGLSECIQSLMRFDTLATIPMTSTGYVRRDARIAVKKNKRNRRIFRDTALSAEEYLHMRSAFRGGDTHANARFSRQTLTDVTSFDIASSYPACMMINKFPMTKFVEIRMETFLKIREEKRHIFLLHICLKGVEFIAQHGIPYIALAKTSYHSKDRVLDNGRIRKAKEIKLWCFDGDMDIITAEYEIRKIQIEKIYASVSGSLPAEYRAVVMDYFRKKTRLKSATDNDGMYNYSLAKRRINALYGMMVMRLDQTNTIYTGNAGSGYEIADKEKMQADYTAWLDETLEKYYKKRNNFLAYQWGCIVTMAARKRLHDMMQIIGRDLVYIDTDSVKFLNYEKHKDAIEAHNKKLQAEAEAEGAFADDLKGVRHYMGVFEYDGHYDQFRTMGAKKYVVNIKGDCYSTIAGVSKKAGQKYFNAHGIDAFDIGTMINDSGHLVAYYNDDDIHDITVDGVTMQTASNLALIDDTYTIGITDDYFRLLKSLAENRYDLS